MPWTEASPFDAGSAVPHLIAKIILSPEFKFLANLERNVSWAEFLEMIPLIITFWTGSYNDPFGWRVIKDASFPWGTYNNAQKIGGSAFVLRRRVKFFFYLADLYLELQCKLFGLEVSWSHDLSPCHIFSRWWTDLYSYYWIVECNTKRVLASFIEPCSKRYFHWTQDSPSSCFWSPIASPKIKSIPKIYEIKECISLHTYKLLWNQVLFIKPIVSHSESLFWSH